MRWTHLPPPPRVFLQKKIGNGLDILFAFNINNIFKSKNVLLVYNFVSNDDNKYVSEAEFLTA